VLTPGQFASELETQQRAIEQLRTSPQGAASIVAGLPEKWVVAVPGGGPIECSSEFLREGVIGFQKAPPKDKPSIIDALSTRLSAMREQAIASETPASVPADAHQRLDQILSAREFRAVKGPNKLEIWRDRLVAWLEAQLVKWGKHLPSSEQSGPIFAWVLIALACSIMGVWIFRRARDVEAEVRREIIPFAPSDKSWRLWLNEAREQANQQQWRDAIHLAFWAAVSKLETEGMWRRDRARTPREYLQAIPATSEVRTNFAAIMRSFETVWYAGHEASDSDFTRVLAELEKMGCQ
jgi:hypothetical protein